MKQRLLASVGCLLLVTACTGSVIDSLANRKTGVEIDLDTAITTGSAELFAFNPEDHALDISIVIRPIEHPDDIDVVIVTHSGIRYQILGSFADCSTDGGERRCHRQLGPLPGEDVGDWRVDVSRTDSQIPANVQISVDWIPIRG